MQVCGVIGRRGLYERTSGARAECDGGASGAVNSGFSINIKYLNNPNNKPKAQLPAETSFCIVFCHVKHERRNRQKFLLDSETHVMNV